jgi:hypothetical protein
MAARTAAVSKWRPDLRDDDDPVRSALERGLCRHPLDAAALARVRAAARAEFDVHHGWRAHIRRWPRRMALFAAALAGVTLIAAVCLY